MPLWSSRAPPPPRASTAKPSNWPSWSANSASAAPEPPPDVLGRKTDAVRSWSGTVRRGVPALDAGAPCLGGQRPDLRRGVLATAPPRLATPLPAYLSPEAQPPPLAILPSGQEGQPRCSRLVRDTTDTCTPLAAAPQERCWR